jgi:hypothetical protein
MLKQAMTELIETLHKHQANQLTATDHEQIVDVPDFEVATKYGTEGSED